MDLDALTSTIGICGWNEAILCGIGSTHMRKGQSGDRLIQLVALVPVSFRDGSMMIPEVEIGREQGKSDVQVRLIFQGIGSW